MRRTTLAVASLALITTLSACGTTAKNQQPGNDQGNTAQQSSKQVGNVSDLVSQASKAMAAKKTATLTITGSGGSNPILKKSKKMTCQVDITKSAMSCDTVIITKDAWYARKSADSGMWMKIPAGGNPEGPRKLFNKFAGLKKKFPAGSRITDSSQVSIAGQSATQYQIEVDLATAAKKTKTIQNRWYSLLIRRGATELTLSLSISESGLPLKFTQVVPQLTVDGKKVPESVTTITYTNWGEPVKIAPPPANKVMDISKMPPPPSAKQPN